MSGTTRPDSTPVTSVADLVAYFRAGAKPRAAWRIGIEQEKIGTTGDGRPVAFDGPAGIEELLARLEAEGEYLGVREGGRLIALRRSVDQITLEPGGQVELSGPPLVSATACHEALLAHVRQVGTVAATLGFRFL